MASKTVKRKPKKPVCKCEANIQSLLNELDAIKKRQDILMDGYTILSAKVNNLSLWSLIKNCFRKK